MTTQLFLNSLLCTTQLLKKYVWQP